MTKASIRRWFLVAARKAKGLTQEELAKELGTTQKSVAEWESGKVNPNANSVKALEAFFGIPAEKLLLEGASGLTQA